MDVETADTGMVDSGATIAADADADTTGAATGPRFAFRAESYRGRRILCRRVQILPLLQWGQFTPALNTIINRAKALRVDAVAFASIEVRVAAGALDRLCHHVFHD